MKNQYILSLLFLLAGKPLLAQNVFHNREFWATKPSVEVVKQKIAEGNDILEMGPGGWDGPLLAIMADCDYETVKFILDQPGIDVNVITHHSNNYLMWTTQKGNVPVMKLLLEKGSKTDIINSHGQSFLMHAALSGKADPEIYDLCLKNGGDLVNDKDEQGCSVMLAAIGNLKDLSFLNYFVSKGLSLNDTDSEGNGLFHYAVPSGNVKTLKELVAMGVSYTPNAAGENAFSFIGRGRGGRISSDILHYLKSLGLDPSVKAVNGQTLVHTVARVGADESILTFLEENKMNLSAVDNEGNTPLILASARGNEKILTYWLKTNDVNFRNKNGVTALIQAVATNTPAAVKLLLDKGAEVTVRDNGGHDLFYHLVSSYSNGRGSLERFNEKLTLLTAKGLNITKRKDTSSLLHEALAKNDTELLKKLLSTGLDINAKDKDGYTLLHYSAMKAKDLNLLKFLTENGADARIATEFDETIFDLIAENEILGGQNLNLDFLKK
jgi:ankyrin repeat protein